MIHKTSLLYSIQPSSYMNHDLALDYYKNKIKRIVHIYMKYEHRECYNYLFDCDLGASKEIVARFIYDPHYEVESEIPILFRTNDIWYEIVDFGLTDYSMMIFTDMNGKSDSIDPFDFARVADMVGLKVNELVSYVRKSYSMLTPGAMDALHVLLACSEIQKWINIDRILTE